MYTRSVLSRDRKVVKPVTLTCFCNKKNQVVRAVCYSPEKGQLLKEKEGHVGVKIDGIVKSPSKRKANQQDITISKKSKITLANVDFNYNEQFSCNMFTVKEVINDCLIYDSVDVKVKVLFKTEEKRSIVVCGKKIIKSRCMLLMKVVYLN